MSESLLTIPEAARACPGDVSPATVWRWARRGLQGRGGTRVHLEHRRVGKKIYVPREALDAFFRATAEADAPAFNAAPTPPAAPPARTPGERSPEARERAATEAAERIRRGKSAA